MKCRTVILLPVLLAALCAESRAVTWLVPSQCSTIQAGIDSASAGDTVLVACGTYFEHSIAMKPGICLRSETGNPTCVTVDAQQHGEILRCEDCASLVRIEGLTLTGGHSLWQGGAVHCANASVAFSECSVSGNYSSYLGGGVYGETSSLAFSDCIISDNWSGSSGGGVYCWDCALDMTDCVLSSNSGGYTGGGLCTQRARLTRCTFSANSARLVDVSGGHGGGAWCDSAVITDCIFRENNACWLGGGLGCYNAVIDNCVFFNNSAGAGAGVYCVDSAATLTNCTLSGNSAPGASGILAENSSVALEKSVVAFGTGGEAVGCDSTASAQLSCCVLYGNGSGNWVGCIADQYPGMGNLATDPLFCDQAGGDLRPCVSSPCLPENNACGVLLGAVPLGECDCPVHATYSVPHDYASISEALAVASYGDTVVVHVGVYEENIVLPWGVKLVSASGADSTMIDGRGGRTTVTVSYEASKAGGADIPARLEGFTITGATRTGIVVLACDPVITDCVVTGNSGLEGGGLSCYAASPRVAYCTVYGNQGSTWGGGFYCEGSSPTVENCTFSRNSAPEGGGIYSRSSRLSLANTVVVFSTAGEAVYCYGDTATLTCCDLFGNAGGDWVGAVENQYGSNGNFSANPLFCDPDLGELAPRISSPCLPENNTCGLLMGALPFEGCTYPVCEAYRVPQDCASIAEALALASYGDTVLVSPGTYEENVQLPAGVTLRSMSGADSTVIDAGGGTGLRISGDDSRKSAPDIPARLEGLTITGAGGTGVVATAGAPRIAQCILAGNSGEKGGGVSCEGGTPVITHCAFTGNRASTAGGGLYAENSSPTVESCTFSGNSAPGGGGVASRCSSVDLSNSIIAFSDDGGAVECLDGGTVALTCCDLYRNCGGDWVGEIAGQLGSGGNISVDPLFCNADSGDFHLDEHSLCAPGCSGDCGLIGALGTACAQPPPVLSLGILQDPEQTERFEVHLASSVALDSASVLVKIGPDTLGVRKSGSDGRLWVAQYLLTQTADSLVLRICASDSVGRDTCVVTMFSATFVAAAKGGVVASADGRLRLILGARSITKDAYFLVLPEWSSEGKTPAAAVAARACQEPDLTSDSYSISPVSISEGRAAMLEYSYEGTDLEGKSPEQLYLERVGSGPLRSLVDPAAKKITATVDELGAFRAAAGPAGTGTVRDARFLEIRGSFPNPFGEATTIRFEIRDRQRVAVDIFDVRGRLVARVLDSALEPGVHEILWDGTSGSGEGAPPGVYFYRVRGTVTESVGKIVLAR